MKHLIAPSFSGERSGWLSLPPSARLPEPWKPISDPVQCSKWAGPGTFQNGSLAGNIIRNTLGYRLISLQCEHMSEFVLMQGAQARLVTRRVSLSLPRSSSLLSPDAHVTPGLRQDINNAYSHRGNPRCSYMSCAWTGLFSPVKFIPLSP